VAIDSVRRAGLTLWSFVGGACGLFGGVASERCFHSAGGAARGRKAFFEANQKLAEACGSARSRRYVGL
jgi:hypothetical protein